MGGCCPQNAFKSIAGSLAAELATMSELIESAQDGLKISSDGLDNGSLRLVMEGSRNDPRTMRP